MSLDCRVSAGLNWGVPGAGWDLHETQSQLAEKLCPPDPVSDWIPYREAAAVGKASPFPWLGNCGKLRKPRDNGCLDCGSLSQQFREGGLRVSLYIPAFWGQCPRALASGGRWPLSSHAELAVATADLQST